MFAVGILLDGCRQAEWEEVKEARRTPVEVVELERVGGYAVERRFVGRIEARQGARLGFELPGLLAEVRVEEGERVAAGQVLARLDTVLVEAREAELVAGVARAKVAAGQAERSAMRQEKLLRERAVAEEAAERARQEADVAAAELAATEARLAGVRAERAKCELRAPFPGEVAARLVDPGAVLAAGTGVVNLLETGKPELRVGFPAEMAAELNPGERLTVELENGERVEWPVLRVLPARDATVRTVDVVLAAGDRGWAEGDHATVVVREMLAAEGFLLPREALTESERGLWACFAIDGAGRLDRREVEIVHAGRATVLVRGGLKAAERVVAGGLAKVAPGQAVEVVAVREVAVAMPEGGDR
jgi:RND family efflux transporter MFP subunit